MDIIGMVVSVFYVKVSNRRLIIHIELTRQ